MDTKSLQPAETVILLAEDDPIVRNLIQTMLMKEHYLVVTANDGEEAFEVFRLYSGVIHLLLTDIRMPRMDGLTLAEKMRTLNPDIKIVVMSGETSTIIRQQNIFEAFLRKPFIPPTLLQCVQRVLSDSFRGVCEEL